jgi:cystatin-A/B
MPICGGPSDSKPANDEIQQICNQLKSSVEAKAGKAFPEFTALSFKSQVVAGTNYFVKVHVGSDECVHVRIHKPLPHSNEAPSVHSCQLDKTKDEEIGYF